MARSATFLRHELKREISPAREPLADRIWRWRCSGLMVVESCFDLAGDAGQLDCLTRRCVQCGEVIDPLILQNRRLQVERNFVRA